MSKYESPLISIIIPNYNYGQYLQDAIESALTQTHQPVEVIVVDDGSTDNSAEIIRSYGGRITAIFQHNKDHQARAMLESRRRWVIIYCF
jgi:glycosyltransferase involved in cell wall biosynthesis